MTSNNSDIYESVLLSAQYNSTACTKKSFLLKYLNNKKMQLLCCNKNITMILILLLLFIGFSSATLSKSDIKVNVKIPKEAKIGDYIDMQCNWEIHGNKSLYSVKWYKDGHEFFRYVPNNPQSIQTFPQLGVKLQNLLSRANSIRLMDLTLASAGLYKCEVSTDGPAFATSFMTGNLYVVCE
ncbi:GSCOCG00011895001-RA-CDS [Cotesia congregata]|nr:GSCOCG00011895001-RA-CDS [Cotesia congregata]